jgi:hypothetical protein
VVIARAPVSDHGNVSRFLSISIRVSKTFHESRGNQYKLLDWLNALVFPTESKFNDDNVEFVQKTYQSVVRRVLDFGVR